MRRLRRTSIDRNVVGSGQHDVFNFQLNDLSSQIRTCRTFRVAVVASTTAHQHAPSFILTKPHLERKKTHLINK